MNMCLKVSIFIQKQRPREKADMDAVLLFPRVAPGFCVGGEGGGHEGAAVSRARLCPGLSERIQLVSILMKFIRNSWNVSCQITVGESCYLINSLLINNCVRTHKNKQ